MPAQAGTLAVVGFGTGAGRDPDPRCLRVPLRSLDRPAPVERWWVEGEVRHGVDGELTWACGGGYLLLTLVVAEADHDGPRGAAAHAYRLLLQAMDRHRHPFLLRCWNYLDAINEGDGDGERYRQFSIGRAEGIARLDCTDYPAATAIGRVDGVRELVVFALAAQAPGLPVENPRQVSAYRYPRQYGPVPPSFARAMRLASPRPSLLISGTASVVGHATLHESVVEQTEETLRNLDALVAQAGMGRTLSHGDICLKAYLRHGADLEAVRARLAVAGLDVSRILFLEGDICRHDLLVEIDGVLR
ncbi:MAG: pteridine-dependent deoxygenase [Xanthomonadales bacterium]|nr:pteridine-dependent deoxygenase [Xanthomonadales bacterium]